MKSGLDILIYQANIAIIKKLTRLQDTKIYTSLRAHVLNAVQRTDPTIHCIYKLTIIVKCKNNNW